MTIAVLILGAGSSSRMRGGDKLLEPVEGVPLLAKLAQRALATGAEVAVTLPSASHPRGVALDGLDVIRIEVPDAGDGMSASLRRGAAMLSDREAMMVLPGDMPEIGTADIAAMIAAFRAAGEPPPILRATDEAGNPGHPVLFPRRLLSKFATLAGDTGAAPILRAHMNEVRPLPLPARRALTDLDSPEDWAEWRSRH